MGSRKKRTKAKPKPARAPAPTLAPSPTPAPEPAQAEPVEDIEAIEIDLDADDDGIAVPNASRRAPRVALDERVLISGFFESAVREDRVRDASTQGVFVETAHPLDVGDAVVLHLPVDGGKRLRVTGRVRWVSAFGSLKDARAGMGIELVGMSGEQREALSAMLRRRARA